MSISPYTYEGLLYCKECGKDICNTLLTKYSYAPEDVSNYSSWDFPKPHHASKAVFPSHCASSMNCLNAIELSSGRKIGTWLGNELTDQGIEFVLQEIRSKGERAEIWADFYSFTLSQYMMKKLGKVLGYEKEDRTLDFPLLDDLKAENIALRAIKMANDNEILRLRKHQRHLEAEISRLKRDSLLMTLYHFNLLPQFLAIERE